MHVWLPYVKFLTFLLGNAYLKVYKIHMYNLENDFKMITSVAIYIKKYNIAT